jgi:hypothetical protein
MIPDFDLSAVPLRGALAPIVGMLSDGDGVFVDAGDGEGWRAQVIVDPSASPGWVVVSAHGQRCLCSPDAVSVDLATSPAARSAVVAWLASQGHADAGASDAALLSALRHVCGLPPAPASESCDDIPF